MMTKGTKYFLGQHLHNLLEKINIKNMLKNGCYAFLLFNHILICGPELRLSGVLSHLLPHSLQHEIYPQGTNTTSQHLTKKIKHKHLSSSSSSSSSSSL